VEKSKICFIRARQKEDYVVPAIEKTGYKVIIPYKDYNLFFRLCREAWFRMGLPKRELWMNPATRSIKEDIIVVKDPLIVKEFMQHLRELYPTKMIIFDYDNRVSNSLNPDLIREYVDEIWHYDDDDCFKYNLRRKGLAYYDVYQVQPNPVRDYDVFYVGRDKGRLSQMDEIKADLEAVGLKTHFHICANREFLTWTNKRYKHFLPYREYLELLKRSKAILNIVPEGQKSITQREMEAVFDGVKCITNNKGIASFPLYDESRYFILDHNYEAIPEFLNREFKSITEEEIKPYQFASFMDKMLDCR